MTASALRLANDTGHRESAAAAIHFGPFRLLRGERRLERDGETIQLGGKALDILLLLTDRPGQVISKAELTRSVWSGMIVEEGSLRFHIVALRKALGETAQKGRYLTTVAGRGYCFTGSASRAAPEPADIGTPIDRPKPPPNLRKVIGLGEVARDAGEALLARRFLTLVGPPGIGKTTLAIKLGHDLERDFPGGVAFVELGSVRDSLLVANAIAAALGRVLPADPDIEHLLAIFRARRMLLIVDNCEHVIDAVASLAEQLFHHLPGLGILATSRESLRAEGEHVYRLFPLACPPASLPLSSQAALRYPAVEFFVDRVQVARLGFQLSDDDAPLVGEICRKLDGIPLALELAAGRVPAYGIQQTAALLDGHFRLLWEGRRTAPPRLQTLSAAFDWSHDLLSAAEQAVLRRISIFVGSFTLEAAIAVASWDGSDRDFVVRILANLVSKSLVVLQERLPVARYRLLDTTRVYGLAKLLATQEAPAIRHRHARFFRDLLLCDGTVDAFLTLFHSNPYDDEIGNIRTALQWSFSAAGPEELAVSLAAASCPLLLDLSLPAECRDWIEKALPLIGELDRGGVVEMQLQTSLGLALMAMGINDEAVEKAFERGLEIARGLGDRYHQFRLLGALHIFALRSADCLSALVHAEKGRDVALAATQPAMIAMAEAMITVAHHFAGDHVQSRGRLTASIALPSASPRSGSLQMGHDHRSRIQSALARDLWIKGDSLAARRAAHDAIEDSRHAGNPLAYSISLLFCGALFLWLDDVQVAEEMAGRLVAHAIKHGLECYAASGGALWGIVDLRHDRPRDGGQKIAVALAALRRRRFDITTAWLLGAQAECHAQTGDRREALTSIDQALDFAAQGGAHFHTPELLRVKGEILAVCPGMEAQAIACLNKAVTWARRQSAPAWALRASLSLTRLKMRLGQADEEMPGLEIALAAMHSSAGSADYAEGAALLQRPCGAWLPRLISPHKSS